MVRLILAVVMIAVAVTAQAAKPKPEKPKAVDLNQPFLAQMGSIEKVWKGGDAHAEISCEDHSTVRRTLSQTATALRRNGGDTLNKAEQTKLLNEQDLTHQILGQAVAHSRIDLPVRNDDRSFADRHSVQKTVAARRREAPDAEDAMRRNPTDTYNKGG